MAALNECKKLCKFIPIIPANMEAESIKWLREVRNVLPVLIAEAERITGLEEQVQVGQSAAYHLDQLASCGCAVGQSIEPDVMETIGECIRVGLLCEPPAT